jgi:hypothetical protein
LGLLQEIGDELYGFAAWLWGQIQPPARKPWCAAFYFVAQEDGTLSYPENTLDQKMAEAVEAVSLTAGTVKTDVHVVYRTVPSDPLTADPIAKVVRFLGPETGTVFFKDCYIPGSIELVDTGKDLTCFLKWVYKWCPADRYAIFIWGHSFGPAGLFEPGSGLNIPKPGVAALAEAFEQFKATRIAGDPVVESPEPTTAVVGSQSVGLSPGTSGGGGSGTSAGGSAVQQWAAGGDKKVEIVLFQDCWMSTLETAFEIAESTNLMIGSQSLIPIGRHYANFIWPYENLLKALNAPTFAADMANLIVQFYKDHFAQVQYLPTIPISLFDLSAVPTIDGPLKTLVTTLATLPPAERVTLLEPARLVKLDKTNPYHPILLAGDGALVDMLKLCTTLQTTAWPALGSPAAQGSARTLAADVETELKKLVTLNTEAHPLATADFGFQGVSAFHWPPVGTVTDDFITEAIRRSVSAYQGLALVKQTGWDQLGLEHKPSI